MSDASDLPLVTLAVFAYNQEHYIAEALAGALAQDYARLEVIISDDCSTDMTAMIIEAEVERYTGPHRVLINRMQRNLGLAAHIERVFAMASGDVVVMAAGDDISRPARVTQVVAEFRHRGLNPKSTEVCVYSDYVLMGEPTPVSQVSTFTDVGLIFGTGPVGATIAVSRRLVESLGRIRRDLVNEDRLLSFAACVNGMLLHIPIPLVEYRPGGLSTIGEPSRSQSIQYTRRYLHDASSKIDFLVGQLTKGSIERPGLRKKYRRLMFAACKERRSRALELSGLYSSTLSYAMRLVWRARVKSVIRGLLWLRLKTWKTAEPD